jgi:hypothetical protein
MKLFISILILAVLALTIGVIQDHYNDPLRHCRLVENDTHYKGYACPNGSVYTR